MNTEGTPAMNKPAMKKWLKLLLAGSLALNLAMIGIAAGAALRYGDKDRDWHRRPPPSVGAMIFRQLDAETRESLRQQAGGGHGSFMQRRHAEGAAVIAALRSSDFDAAALLAVLRTQAESRHVFHTRVQETWVRKLAAMTPAERAVFADRMEQRMRWFGQHPVRTEAASGTGGTDLPKDSGN
ncbi:periplasmic heavy metal sensor [Leisingera sp. S232]|uniref:periplasmic heavy metal sensor n=1 Tax=Leisingera sp. S232 TaxID=3415132 RepID=UPI003C7C0417